MKNAPVMEELVFTALAFGGNAVARRSSGKVCFVPDAIPGERALVNITEEKKNYSYGEIISLQEVAPERCENFCSSECPGCPYRMMTYPLELEWKMRQLEGFIRKLKRMTVKEILPPEGAICRTNWRNKVSFHYAEGKLNYIGRDNLSFVPVHECPAASEMINQVLQEGSWKKDISLTDGEKVTFRSTEEDGVCVYTEKVQEKRVLTEKLGPFGAFQVEMRSFFQINTFMAPRLAGHFLDTLEKLPVKQLVELYCGCGVFSILAAEKRGIACCGIELDASSIFLAEKNAQKHNTERSCRFYAGDAGKVMKDLYRKKTLPPGTLLLVDPPRSGLAPNALSSLLASEPDWIIYISCNPASLMRDLELLAEKYDAEQIKALDMFPATAHFETLILLQHK